MEIWKDIPGFEGSYQASNLGRVRCKQRYVSRTPRGGGDKHFILRPEKILTPKKRDQYLAVQLHQSGDKVFYSIHRLVALAFLYRPDGYNYVNHKDENKYNNHVDNLEWCTESYNQRYSKGIKIILQHDSGEIKEFGSRAEAREYTGISFSYFWHLTSGKIAKAKGWRML